MDTLPPSLPPSLPQSSLPGPSPAACLRLSGAIVPRGQKPLLHRDPTILSFQRPLIIPAWLVYIGPNKSVMTLAQSVFFRYHVEQSDGVSTFSTERSSPRWGV